MNRKVSENYPIANRHAATHDDEGYQASEGLRHRHLYSVHPRVVVLLLVATLGFPTFSPAGHAQVVPINGTVVDADTGAPVHGAVVIAFDADDRQLRGTLTTRDGTFELPVDPARVARLFAERLGYAASTVSAESLAGRDVSIVIPLAPNPVRLIGVVASARAVCETDPTSGGLTHALWTAARASLRAAFVSEEEGLVLFRIATWLREIERNGTLRYEQERAERVTVRHPFITREPEELAAEGWVVFDGTEYVFFGPDARALLSDAFRDTHCFRPASSNPERQGLIGLTFEPLPRRSMPDIAGTFWMHPDSGELQLVEYRYMDGDQIFRLGGEGEIHFRTLDSGAWVVERWAIRAPIGSPGQRGRRDRSFDGFFEAGGELLEVLAERP